MKLRIADIVKIEDVEGKWGPQKKITLRDDADRVLSGFVNAQYFRPEEWQTGKEINVEVTQNKGYWNFRVMTKKTEDKEEIIGAIRLTYTMMKAELGKLEKRIIELHRTFKESQRISTVLKYEDFQPGERPDAVEDENPF